MGEFDKLRVLLSENGVFWYDDTAVMGLNRPMYRTKGEGFSVIYGYGSYGYEAGLLELMDRTGEVTGFLTAEEVLEIILSQR